MDLPTGTVTFLFTDVEGSTRLAKALGAAGYSAVLDEHRRLLRGVFRDAGGIEVDSQGDGFFVAFRSGSEAVRAAARVQRALAQHRWPEDAAVRVRIGIHTGEAAVVDEGYRGLSVHRAARICASAHGGQVLLSDTTRDLVEGDLPPGVGLSDLGLAHLRDLDRPERLFQLVVEDLRQSFPPPRGVQSGGPVRGGDLLEREAELAALEAFVGAPDQGRLLAIEGTAGIGKTRLLAEARASGQAAGMQVLAARGSELECEIAYGVVRQLFEPLLAAVSAEERAALLAGAAELARPIFDPARFGAEPDADSSLAMLHGLFWLTANLADRQAVLVAIDDLHWCDPPSLRWLAYLLPRLEGLPLLIVVGLRPSEPGADVALLARITSDPLATVLRPAALSEQATGELMSGLVSADVEEAFRAAFHEASGGNPLLVRELASAVAAEGLAPTAENAPRLHELGGHAVSRAVALRLSGLPGEATRLARAVALLGDDADLRHAGVLAGLDEPTASDAAARLGQVEILHRRVPLAFVHPVVRAAVYGEIGSVEKDRGHSRAARLLAESGAEPDRVAAHLLLTTRAADSWVIGMLRDAARSAVGRGAPDSAVTYLRRALEETSDADTQAAVLHELGAAEVRVAAPEALEHLAAARAATSDVRTRARIALDLGAALFSMGQPPEQAVEVLQEGIAELAGAEPELELELENLLISVARFEPGLYPIATERLERLRAAMPQAAAAQHVVLANLASDAARAGVRIQEAVDLAERALAGNALMTEHFDPAFLYAALALVSADRLDAAFRLFSEAMDEARKRGVASQFCFASAYRSLVSFHRGALSDAVADAELSLGAIELHGLEIVRRYAAAFLVDALIERGEWARARQVIDSVRVGHRIESYGQSSFFDARARLWLAEGEHARALRDFLELGGFLEDFGVRNPALVSWRSQAALALLGLGRTDEARRYAADELALAREWGVPRPLGKALVAAGLVERGEEGIALMQEAVALLEPSGARLEYAKALVELGSALRRANRRSDAREPLRRGLELATICGAVPLAERAETELLATGARPRRIALSGVDALTPSERRVAQMAAEGSTNREIAQALFVTTKTVEVHLSSVYRKLEIGSRSQLAGALATPESAPPMAQT